MAEQQQVIERVRQRLIDGTLTQEQAEQVLRAMQQEEPQPLSMGQRMAGAGETALSFATGALAEPLAGLHGMANFAARGPEAGAAAVEQARETLTYQPRTEGGQRAQQAVGEFLQPVGERLQEAERALADSGGSWGGAPGAAISAALPAAILEVIGVRGGATARRGAINEAYRRGRFEDVAGPGGRLNPEVRDVFERAGTRVETLDDLANLNPDQVERLMRFDQMGVEPTRGQLRQDFPQQQREARLAESAADAAGEDMRQIMRQQSEGFTGTLESMINDLGLPGRTGQSVREALTTRESQLRSARSRAYDNLAQAQQGTDVPLITSNLTETMPSAGEMRDLQAMFPGQTRAMDDLLAEFGVSDNPQALERLSSAGVQPQPLTLENFERMRKRLNNIAQSDNTGNMQRAVMPVIRKLDEEVDLATQRLELSDAPDIANMAKEARQSHIALRTEFDDSAMSQMLIAPRRRGSSVPGIEESQIYQRLAAPGTPIEQVDRVMQSLTEAGEAGQRAIGDLQSQIIMDLVDSGLNATTRKVDGVPIFGGTAFARRYERLEPKIERIFADKPEMIEQLRNANQVARDMVPPSGAMPKGSASYLMDALHRMGVLQMGSAIPGAGPMLIRPLQDFSQMRRDRGTIREAMNRNPEMQRQAEFIAYGYPSLAVTLGLGDLIQETRDAAHTDEQD